MVFKPIIIVAGEPNSIFSEIFFKSINYKKFKSPIILIASLDLIKLQMKKLKMNKKIKLINLSTLKNSRLDNNKINLINVNFVQKNHLIKFLISQMNTSKNHLILLLKF